MLLLNDKKIEIGNTVRIKVLFTDFDGVPVDPDIALFKVYDRKRTELLSAEMEKVSETDIDKKTGIYQYFYTPTEEGEFTIEIYGSLGDFSSLIRRKITVVFNDGM